MFQAIVVVKMKNTKFLHYKLRHQKFLFKVMHVLFWNHNKE